MDYNKLSIAVSHALRHEPWLFGLELDDGGWCGVEELLDALRSGRPEWDGVTVDDLQCMIDSSPKKRHEIQGDRIRATYGHSVRLKFNRPSSIPPSQLFHGTALESYARIRREGLRPMKRQFVHLSVDASAAQIVGARKSKEVVVLVIDAESAERQGIRFYQANESIWLADYVPPGFISA